MLIAKEYLYMIIVLTVICLILQRNSMTWSLRAASCVAFVIIFYYALNYIEYHSASNINQVQWKEGMVISYAYQNLANSFDALVILRLMGIQHLHNALVVKDPEDGQLKVLEWRQLDFEFSAHIVELPKKPHDFGHVILVPINSYIDAISKKGVVYRVYEPPPTIGSVYLYTDLVAKIQDEGIIFCSILVCRYLSELGYLTPPPLMKNHIFYYFPQTCAAWYRKSGWKDRLYVLK
jgi:hypothetical protein